MGEWVRVGVVWVLVGVGVKEGEIHPHLHHTHTHTPHPHPQDESLKQGRNVVKSLEYIYSDTHPALKMDFYHDVIITH